MAKIVLDVDSETAEEIMFACKLRAVQKDAPSGTRDRMRSVRNQIEREAVNKLGWDDLGPGGRDNGNLGLADHPSRDNIRVTITSRNRW